MKVKELTADELKEIIHKAIEEKFEEMLGDPDQGLELRETVKKRLSRSLASKSPRLPADKVAKDLGLEW